jgi:ankyrin repeat protein
MARPQFNSRVKHAPSPTPENLGRMLLAEISCAAHPSIARIRRLLEAGARTDMRDRDHMTALMHGIIRGRDDIVDELAAWGAYIHAL